MEKNLIIAIILSILVLVFFQAFFSPLPDPNDIERDLKKTDEVYKQQETKQSRDRDDISFDFKDQKIDDEEIYVLETEKLYLNFSNLGAQITKAEFKSYKKEDSITPLPLFSTSFGQPGIGRLAFYFDEIDKLEKWETVLNKDQIKFKTTKDNLKVIKNYKILSPYVLELTVIAENVNDIPIEFEYSMFTTADIYRDNRLDKRYSGIVIHYNDRKKDEISFSRVSKGITKNAGDFSWIAQKNRHFSMITVPEQANSSYFFYRGFGDYVSTGINALPSIIRAGEIKKHSYLFYLGPNISAKLESFYPGTENIIDFGFFSPISRFLLKVLNFLYDIVHNYGVAIILLTFLINIALFPLSKKSYSSMKKMQDMQPKINELKEKFKDDSQKLNKELMNLYKTSGSNPFGGCLPMLLQFPIFIALYMGLIKSAELRDSGFLWISDLASPDAAFTLPFSLPHFGDKINILPLLMLFAMFFQQRISQKRTAMQTDSQKQLAIIFPLVFGVILYNFPSGLILYWLTNTVLMSFLQWKMFSESKGEE